MISGRFQKRGQGSSITAGPSARGAGTNTELPSTENNNHPPSNGADVNHCPKDQHSGCAPVNRHQ